MAQPGLLRGGLLLALLYAVSACGPAPEQVPADPPDAVAETRHPVAESADLCGTRFDSVERLIEQLQRDERFREAPGPELAAGEAAFRMFTRVQGDVSEEWLIAGPGHRIYPAVSCGRYVTRRERSSHSRATHCRAGASACGEFDLFLKRRDLQPRIPR
jgi:hypothetical protein